MAEVSESKVKDRSGFVYLLKSESGHYKIGRSKDPDSRAESLDSGPLPVSLVHKIAADDACWLEKRLHKKYAAKRVRGEWFSLSDEDVRLILSVKEAKRPASLALGKKRNKKWKVSGRIDRTRPQGVFSFDGEPSEEWMVPPKMKPRPSSATRRRYITLFATVEEHDLIRVRAAESHLSMAEFCRRSSVDAARKRGNK